MKVPLQAETEASPSREEGVQETPAGQRKGFASQGDQTKACKLASLPDLLTSLDEKPALPSN